MLIDFLIENLWAAILLWAASILLNHLMVERTLRVYRKGADQHFFYGVSPELQQKAPVHAPVSLGSTLRTVLAGSTAFFLVWLGGRIGPKPRPEFFEGILGSLLLVGLVAHVRNFRNLALYRYAAKSIGVSGRVEIAHWLALKVSAAEFLGWASLFCALFILFGRWFFFGGMAACLLCAAKQLRWSRKVAAAAGAAKS